MTFTLALRNLFHDRVQLIVTLVGILFSVVLMAVQLGLYLGARSMITATIDRADGDVWVMAYGTKNFEEATPIDARTRYTALSVPGVVKATPLATSFTEWKKPQGGTALAVIIGADVEDGGLVPWNIAEGTLTGLGARDAVFVDRTYLEDLGVAGLGDTAQVGGNRVKIAGITDGIRSFTVSPFVFTTLNRGRALIGMPSDKVTYVLVKTAAGADAVQVRDALRVALPDVEVLTKPEFRERSLKHWLFATGAGIALLGGAALGLLVGTVIVAQTLYGATKDHINEFATLRALGSSSGFIHKVILAQAGLSAVLGYGLGMIVALSIALFTADTALPILMTPGLAALLFALTVAMCAVSAIAAINKVTKIDPVVVFNR